jgi:hypothetical protein
MNIEPHVFELEHRAREELQLHSQEIVHILTRNEKEAIGYNCELTWDGENVYFVDKLFGKSLFLKDEVVPAVAAAVVANIENDTRIEEGGGEEVEVEVEEDQEEQEEKEVDDEEQEEVGGKRDFIVEEEIVSVEKEGMKVERQVGDDVSQHQFEDEEIAAASRGMGIDDPVKEQVTNLSFEALDTEMGWVEKALIERIQVLKTLRKKETNHRDP